MNYTVEAHHELRCLVLAAWGAGQFSIYQSNDYIDAATFAADVANGWDYTLIMVVKGEPK